MKAILTIFFSFLLVSPTLAQGAFEKAVSALETKSDYYLQTDSIIYSDKIGVRMQSRFKACQNYHPAIAYLSFDSIISVKSADLKNAKHKNFTYPAFIFKEWTFATNANADQFMNILEADTNGFRLQECISKGGITWWAVENKIYIILSHAYFMTFKYPELKAVILPNL